MKLFSVCYIPLCKWTQMVQSIFCLTSRKSVQFLIELFLIYGYRQVWLMWKVCERVVTFAALTKLT